MFWEKEIAFNLHYRLLNNVVLKLVKGLQRMSHIAYIDYSLERISNINLKKKLMLFKRFNLLRVQMRLRICDANM